MSIVCGRKEKNGLSYDNHFHCNTGVVKDLFDYPPANGEISSFSLGYTAVNITSDRCGDITLLCYVPLGASERVSWEPLFLHKDVFRAPYDLTRLCPTIFMFTMLIVMSIMICVVLSIGCVMYVLYGSSNWKARPGVIEPAQFSSISTLSKIYPSLSLEDFATF